MNIGKSMSIARRKIVGARYIYGAIVRLALYEIRGWDVSFLRNAINPFDSVLNIGAAQ